MATCLNEVTTNMLKNLKLRDVMCPVCRGIFIEPVLMPCRHALCLQCFERTMEENSLTCPVCRKRIGSWLRTSTKEQKLVHKELWAFIQKQFSMQVQAKLNGEDDGVEEHVIGSVKTRISTPGEIRKEYESHIKTLEEEARKKLEAERLASEDFIRKLQEEEEKQYLIEKQQLLKQTAADEQLAKELQEQSVQSTSGLMIKKEPVNGMDNKENKNSSHASVTSQIRGPMDSYLYSQKKSTVSAGKFLTTSDSSFNVKYCSNKQKVGPVSELEKFRSVSNISTGSHDSINQEMHHFKPIKSVPRTPPKKLSDSRVHVPMVVKAVPVNLNPLYESCGVETYVSTSYRQQVLKVQRERIKNLKGVLRTSESYPPISAFRGKAVWQKSESTRARSEGVDVEQSEEMESPRKKSRQDFSSGAERSNFAMPQLSSYSNEDCKGKKVIAIVHNQSDELVHAEGKIGGHDRRFGGSEKEDSSSFNLISNKDDDSDDDSGQLDYDDPHVMHIIGVEPELNSQTFMEARFKSKSSSGDKLSMDRLCIDPTDKTCRNHCKPHHAKRNNIARKVCNNISDYTNVSNVNSAKKVSPAKCKDNLDEIVPFSDEDSTTEQARIERMIRQEQEDFELALRLQEEWDKSDSTVDRSKGSLRAYELRNACKSRTSKKKPITKKNGRGRQSTLEESFTGVHSSRKWKFYRQMTSLHSPKCPVSYSWWKKSV